MAKMLEDAFRSFGILADDDPKHVARSILEVNAASTSKRSKTPLTQGAKADEKNEDYVEITIKPYGK